MSSRRYVAAGSAVIAVILLFVMFTGGEYRMDPEFTGIASDVKETSNGFTFDLNTVDGPVRCFFIERPDDLGYYGVKGSFSSDGSMYFVDFLIRLERWGSVPRKVVLVYVAVDDTDSANGNCTTFLATEIVRDMVRDHDLIGNPRLVRLNPAVPWKTRGNGALVMEFGRGVGKRRKIGECDGRDVLAFEKSDGSEISEEELDETLRRLIPLVDSLHEDDAQPGLLVSSEKPLIDAYWKGVRTILSRDFADSAIETLKASAYEINGGRGLIGCVCALAWEPGPDCDHTFELLAYRPRSRWGTVREYDPETIREVELGYPTTFNSWDERSRKVAMVPATPCPVMYGLRGDVEGHLIEARGRISTEPLDRWMVFLTNQGTDDHVVEDPDELVPDGSYRLHGTVEAYARHIAGGHVFVDVRTRHGTVTCGAYEPSKEFRHAVDWLAPGDGVEVVGELRDVPRTLNLEKLHVVSLAREYVKVSNPVCPVCGRTMKSKGAGQPYRCRDCGTSSSEPVTEEVRRPIVPGWYEPPTDARRHLSKPLKRMGERQPVFFDNGRT